MTKAEKTKAFIIEKVAPIFNKKGYAGTSLTDITGATGLTKGALYGNFKNKDEIALAVYDYNIQMVTTNFFPSPQTPGGPLEKLLAMPAFYKKNFSAIAAHGGCPIMNAAVEADDNQPLLKKKVNKTLSAWKKYFITTIDAGIAGGEIKTSIDPSKYAAIFIALFEGGVMLSKSTGDVDYINHALDKITDIINTELRK